jgi:hypothetical protein
VVSLLIALHPLRRQDNENRVLMQEVVDQHTANFIVKPLLNLRPILTLRLIKLINQSQTILISVMTQPIF